MNTPTGPDASSVLDQVRAGRSEQARAELRTLNAVVEWCVIHETDDEGEASFGDHDIPLAGDGAPWVSEFAVMERGTALGVSTDSAKRYVGAALEVRHRLPKLWERVASGDLPFWKARFIAERTMCLPEQGAAFVDQQVAFVAHKIGYAETQRQIDAAQLRFDPEDAEKARRQEVEHRKFDIHKDQVSPAGTVDVSGTLDFDKTRPLMLHIHGDSNVGRCDNTRTPVLAETIREWCGNPHATIIVKPVKDLADHIHVAAYEVPDRLVEQDALVDLHCVFPWCTRPAVRCDCDHAVPYGEGGPTCSCNTAPLCRGHHRLKTHGGWTYDVLDRGTYLWHTPHGHLFRRDHTGTEPLAGEP